jgi:CTP synthase (UTP-ammonia lyase)
MRQVTIAIAGDHDPANATHEATGASLDHAAHALGLDLSHRWVPTPDLAEDAARGLAGADAVLIAPGSPYASMEGALAAIRLARETGLPLLGTCGGFQHVVIEYARSVLGFADAQHAETDPGASTLFVTPLSCSLVGMRMRVLVEPGTRAAAWYGASEAEERYYCNFGLNPEYQSALHDGGLRVTAVDDGGEARIVELTDHPFFVGTLFVPQTSSTSERPHPLIAAFARAAAARAGVTADTLVR